jgi:hypothetical protein
MLESITNLLKNNEDLGEDALGVLSETVEADPKFFKKQFELFF